MNIDDRLEALERQLAKVEGELAGVKRGNRRILAVVVVTVVGLGLAWALTETTPAVHAQGAGEVQQVIRANEFVLEDRYGRPRAVLAAPKEGPLLSLLDENGWPRVGVGMGRTGPMVTL